MKKLFVILLLSLAYPAWAQTNYSLLGVPDSLLKNANSILRKYEETFTVENAGKAIHKIHYVCTILNKAGDSEGVMAIYHDKLIKINYLEGKLYDALGNQVSTLKKTNVEDRVQEADYEFTDTKQRVAKFEYGEYPYTVEYEYELVHTNMMFYPIFRPQESYDMAVQEAILVIRMPEDMKLRYKEVNTKTKMLKGIYKGVPAYTFSVRNLPAHEPEVYATHWQTKTPIVYTAPAEFEVSGYKGAFNTWDDFGKFKNVLNKDRQALPPATIAHIQNLTAKAPTKYEKAKLIYEYMQSKTRYVSIQLGIGGWQTLPAELVDKKGYGDCKALSNYMKSMLKTVGIESHYTIVNSGRNAAPVPADFPCSMFNHIILCVPMERDTVWLECTDQNQPFGFLGSHTDDRYCLLVTDTGGKLVRTPKYTQAHNTQTRQIVVKSLPTGEASAKIVTTYTGLQTENHGLHQYIHESKATQKQWLIEKHLEMPQFDLVSFEYAEKKAQIPSIVETLEVKLKALGTKNGKRIFLTPNLMNKTEMPFPNEEKRDFDIELSFPDFTDVDTIRYELPEGYHVEGTPVEHNLKTVFGEYKTTIKVEQGVLTYIRTKSMKGGRYPKEKYKELVEFYRNVVKADNSKIVLVKQT
jgi:Domain of Unknown Function with PDB structure (DUF3857)/Transglutaminase-like superfamily